MIEIKNVFFKYNSEVIVDHLDFEVREGEMLIIVGPSGCGKSTFLRLMAGLETPNDGEISISQNKKRTNLRFLFQDYDAFPWYTTWQNVKNSFIDNNYVSDKKVKAILERVGLLESQTKYPGELSGGMRKRLALARCLVADAPLLLLDEPFSKLDVDTRYEMCCLLQELWQESHQTIVAVTHDLQEAILLGQRILVSTARPFRICSLVDVPFKYPRTDEITVSAKNAEILKNLRDALHTP